MPYKILSYTLKQAIKLRVKVFPSTNPLKKIDVFKDGVKVASVGAIGYLDYPYYIKLHGKGYADERRKLYKMRHAKDRFKVGSNGYYADKLLW
jgi:hypothetical protein